MSDTRPTNRRLWDPAEYSIRVAGHLDQRWAEWFDGLTLTRHDDGSTVLQGRVADQPALHGLLAKIRDLGLTLLSVTPATPVGSAADQADPHTDNRTTRSTP